MLDRTVPGWKRPGRAASVAADRERLIARPAFSPATDQARPYRAVFPGGAPDRD